MRHETAKKHRAAPPAFCGAALPLVVALCLLSACQGPSTPPAGSFTTPPGALLLATDPAAIRLQDIGDALVIYFAHNRYLPASLAELHPRTPDGADIPLTSPASGRPFVYVPSGLPVAGTNRVLLIYDPVAGQDGLHWALVAIPPEGHQPLTVEVVRLTEPVLQAYLQANR